MKTRSRWKLDGTEAEVLSDVFNEERQASELTMYDNNAGPWNPSLAKEKSEEINDSDEVAERIVVGLMDLSSGLYF